MSMRTVLSVVLALAVVLPTTGCPAAFFGAGAAVGAGTLVWRAGWLRANIPEPLERVHRAAKAAVADVRAVLEEDTLKSASGIVDATMPDGRRVVVETRVVGPKETEVRIRVGFWGDQARSLALYEQIKKHL